MHPQTDSYLLRLHLQGDPTAFSQLVKRHTNLVYSAALRQTHGNTDLAEDITQATFILLSARAAKLNDKVIISAWLYRAARYCAKDAMKKQRRRRHHEAHAAISPKQATAVPSDDRWADLAPLIDDAMESLREKDRAAVLLRFFQGLSFREVATALGATEPAAAQRVSRALERLRQFFSRHGVHVPSIALATTLTARAVESAPSHLSGTIASSSASSHALHTSIANGASKMMFWTRAKLAAVAASIALAAAVLPASMLLSGSNLDGHPIPISATTSPLFHQALPEGGTLEVCLTDPDGDSTRFWNPDGSLVQSPKFQYVINQPPTPLPNGERRIAVLIHAIDAQGHKTAVAFSAAGNVRSFGVGAASVYNGPTPQNDWEIETVTLDTHTLGFGIDVGLDIGQWHTLATWGPNGQGATMLIGDPNFVAEAGIPAQRDGELIVPLALQFPKNSAWLERLVAVLKTGKRQPASTRLSMRLINGVGITSFVFWPDLALKPDDVDHYELEVLPQTKLLLKNLPASPGGATPAIIQVLPPYPWPKLNG